MIDTVRMKGESKQSYIERVVEQLPPGTVFTSRQMALVIQSRWPRTFTVRQIGHFVAQMATVEIIGSGPTGKIYRFRGGAHA